MNLLTIFKPKYQVNQELKARVLKNREAILDAFSSNIEGAKCCPMLSGQKCLGKMCELFQQFYSLDDKGNKTEYWRCAFAQSNILLIELNQNIRALFNSQNKGDK